MGKEPEAGSGGMDKMVDDRNADAAAVRRVAKASKCKGRANNDGRDLGRRWSW